MEPKFIKQRIIKTRELMKEVELDALLIDSGVNRFYLSGFTGSAGRVLLTLEKNYFITDFRYTEQAREQTKGFEIVELNKDMEAGLAEILQQERISRLGFESGVISYAQYRKYQEKFSDLDLELVVTKDLIQKLRLIKDEYELKQIRKAVDIADKAFIHILDYLQPGVSEKEVALELEYFMKKQGGEKNSFDFIVASGKRSSLPHGVASDKKIRAGDFVTMDFGTVYRGYCSDMTRTVVMEKPDPEQSKIYNLVLDAHLQVIEEIKPGITTREADAIARDIINKAGYEDNFGHGLGHGVGIEVHEKPRVSYTSEARLEPGMVITDEPGVYIPDWGGVRIEDDLLITEDGCEVLNNSKKELIAI